ncbi:conserved membrane protein of unknown function [Tepidanaerobacter acetatoxydans Re1]|uniref:ABC-2 type transporter n=1 Tax=Tepidanaerobacter acetatoxydans (strain DSM 21804 / JCM 16047 / Re1) TaxID=1209989 RepID=F4LXH2_TEPAE|nr:ABC transporter permease [Tepidanaerobacter acetatoxydans]AEE91074.1 hypothetical protein TepRe1_0904 [Tepidanaerobacter acetatoxydans Re1]CCP25702.1 conserved membrane protein of unknown function [Tepidanaerobacter acetatoxydans Re1]
MKSFQLFGFECKTQIRNMTFLIILAIFSVFAVSQLTEIFHMPVKSEQDIQALEQSGDRDYIFVKNSEADLASNAVQFLKERIEDGSIPQNLAPQFDKVFKMLKNGIHSFDDVLSEMQNNETVSPWLLACKAQFGQRFGSVQEVNQMILSDLGNTGYSPKLYEKYVTYIQIIASLIIFPLFLFLFTRDYRHGMYEIVYMQPINSSKYLILRYLGAFIPLMLYLYGLGVILNLISAARFATMGYTYEYTLFLPYFMTYIFPTIFFLSSLLTVLILLIKKVTAVFPLYIIFVILNVTPNVFGPNGGWIKAISPIIRLDEVTGTIQATMVNRIIYLVLSMAFLAVACKIYKRLKTDLRKGITI